MYDKCPICGEKIKSTDLYEENVYLIQSNSVCKNKHYGHFYSSGSYCEIIGKNEWFWDHSETMEQRATRKEQKELVLYEILSGNVDFVLNKKADFDWKKFGF